MDRFERSPESWALRSPRSAVRPPSTERQHAGDFGWTAVFRSKRGYLASIPGMHLADVFAGRRRDGRSARGRHRGRSRWRRTAVHSSNQADKLELAMTYSAYREIELVPRSVVDEVSQAILSLADEPTPEGAVMLADAKGCYYLAVDEWYILYHLSEGMDCLTVLGVLNGPQHTVH
jgi:hypothetical protein